MIKNLSKILGKICKNVLIFTLIFSWVFQYPVSFLVFNNFPAEPETAEAAEIAQFSGGLVVYADTVNVGTPKYKTFDEAGGFGAEQSATSVGSSAIEWIRVVASPINDEWIIVTRDAGDIIVAQVCTGVDGGISCGATTTISATAGTHGLRNFDIEYEGLSGDALIVYGNATADMLRKIEWTGGSWTGDAQITTTITGGTVEWVELTSRSTSTNEIGIAYSDDADDVSAYKWSGTAVGNEATASITAGASTGNVRKFDVSFEGTSGSMVVASPLNAAGTTAVGRLTTAGAWTIVANTAPDNVTAYIDLQETNPIDNDIAMIAHGVTSANLNPTEGYETDGSALATNGGIVDGTVAVDTSTNNWATNYMSASTAYLSSTYYAVAVFSDITGADDINWWTMNNAGTWTSQADNLRTRGTMRFLKLFDYPNADKVILFSSDANSDLWADTWNGATPSATIWANLTSGGALETDLSSGTTEVYDFAFRLAPIVIPLPGVPTFDNSDGTNQIAFNNIRQSTTTPTFRVSATSSLNYNRIQIELNASSTFTGASSTQIFSGTYASGTIYNLTANSLSPSLPTTDGATYYVRTRASINGGTNYGDWSTNTWTYTYKSLGNPDWFQTTDEQFNTDTLDALTSGSDSVYLGRGWYDNSWNYRKKISIDHTKVGSGPHIDFPVLISKTDTDLISKVRADGNDIFFTSSDGTTKLFHEIESYSSSTGELTAWVKIPSLSSSINTDIYMYYGSSTASNQQNATETWDTNFKGVYHFNNSVNDATSNTFNGTVTGTTDVAGKIANGRGYTANSTDKVTVTGLMGNPVNVTLSAWANLTSISSSGSEIISLGDNLALRLGSWNTALDVITFYYDGSAWNFTIVPDGSASGWHYIAATFDDAGNVQNSYIDGVLISGSTAFTTPISYASQGANTIIGNHGNGGSGYSFNGTLDEVRVTASVRSVGWLLTEYNNQNSPSTFYSISGQELASNIIATGGNVSSSSGYIYHAFNSSGTFGVTSGAGNVETLVVAGGGGGGSGGSTGGGGGGAGGLNSSSSYFVSTGNYTVTVGDGGAGGIRSVSPQYGLRGGTSTFDTISTTGGGGGLYSGEGSVTTSSGGSGGGGSGYTANNTGGIAIASQGHDGGTGFYNTNTTYGGGGGGGAGTVGTNGASAVGGNGGAGLDFSSIFGTAVGASGWFAGGGGGAGYTTQGTATAGGGAGRTGALGYSATANTGGGGGGSTGGFGGGAGGSGIVMVRYFEPSLFGSIMSTPIGFNFVPGQTVWGEASWSTTETNGSTRMYIYYSSSTSCDTIIPDSAIPGNSAGFISSDSPLNLNSLSTTTYSNICLKSALSYSDGSPSLNDWSVSWGQVIESTSTITQTNYRWRNDDGDETVATYMTATNTAVTSGVYVGDRSRLRIQLSNTGSSTASSYQYLLQYASSLDSCTSWTSVPAIASSQPWVTDLSSYVSDNTRSTDSTFISNPVGKTFVSGYVKTAGNTTPALSLSSTQFTELEYSVRSTSNIITDINYCFRVINAAVTTPFTYSEVPQILVKPILYHRGGGGTNIDTSATPNTPAGGGNNSGGTNTETSTTTTPTSTTTSPVGGGGDVGLSPLNTFFFASVALSGDWIDSFWNWIKSIYQKIFVK